MNTKRQCSHIEMEQSLQALEIAVDDELEALDLLEPFPDRLRSEYDDHHEELKQQQQQQQTRPSSGNEGGGGGREYIASSSSLHFHSSSLSMAHIVGGAHHGDQRQQNQADPTTSSKRNNKTNILKKVFQRGKRNRRGGSCVGSSSVADVSSSFESFDSTNNIGGRYSYDTLGTSSGFTLPNSSSFCQDNGSEELLVEFDHSKSREEYRNAREDDHDDHNHDNDKLGNTEEDRENHSGDGSTDQQDLDESFRFDFEPDECFAEPLKNKPNGSDHGDDEEESFFDSEERLEEEDDDDETFNDSDFFDKDEEGDYRYDDEEQKHDSNPRSKNPDSDDIKPNQSGSGHARLYSSSRTSRYNRKARYRRCHSLDDDAEPDGSHQRVSRQNNDSLRINKTWHHSSASTTLTHLQRAKSADEEELMESSRKIDGVFDDDDFKLLLGEFEKQVQDDLQQHRANKGQISARRNSKNNNKDENDRMLERRRRSRSTDTLDKNCDIDSRHQRSRSIDRFEFDHTEEGDRRLRRSRTTDFSYKASRDRRLRRSRSGPRDDGKKGEGTRKAENTDALSSGHKENFRRRSKSSDRLTTTHRDRSRSSKKEQYKSYDSLLDGDIYSNRRRRGSDRYKNSAVRSKSVDNGILSNNDDNDDYQREADRLSARRGDNRRVSKRTMNRRDLAEREYVTKLSSHSSMRRGNGPRRVEETDLSRCKSDDGVTLNFTPRRAPSRRPTDTTTYLERASSDDGVVASFKNKKDMGSISLVRASSDDGTSSSASRRRKQSSDRKSPRRIGSFDTTRRHDDASTVSDVARRQRRTHNDNEKNSANHQQSRATETERNRRTEGKDRDRSVRRP